jgi:hypothetical protein
MSMGQKKHRIKERRKFDEVKIRKKKNLIDDLPDDNNIQALTADDKDTKLETSYLTPDALRWMNKRRANAGSSVAHITPSRALQLRAIFRGLDFDGSGEISLDELKEAVQYVADADDGGEPLFHNVCKTMYLLDNCSYIINFYIFKYIRYLNYIRFLIQWIQIIMVQLI